MRLYLTLATALTMFQCAQDKMTAGPILWNLQDVAFADGSGASGYFTFDSARGSFSNWSIITTIFSYTTEDSVAQSDAAGCTFSFSGAASISAFLCLNSSSSNLGSEFALASSSFELSGASYRHIVSGQIKDPPPDGGASVPEPSTGLLITVALCAFAVLMRWMTQMGSSRFIFFNSVR
jgi:hypothetical protein